MAQDPDIRLLTSPRIFLVGMAAFLALVGFVVLILYQQIALAFSANPGLNGLILGVLAIGALFTFRQVIRLFREIRWVNSLTGAQTGAAPTPRLLAPMAAMLNAGAGARGLSTITTRAILDSIATRLDEGRELSRYLVGLLVFLGLLGSFWGLLQTVHSIAGVIDSMKTGVDTATMFDDLKQGLSAPIAGMSISFTSSLFGTHMANQSLDALGERRDRLGVALMLDCRLRHGRRLRHRLDDGRRLDVAGEKLLELGIKPILRLARLEVEEAEDERTREAEQRGGERDAHAGDRRREAGLKVVEQGRRIDPGFHAFDHPGDRMDRLEKAPERAKQPKENQKTDEIAAELASLVEPGGDGVQYGAGGDGREAARARARGEHRRHWREQQGHGNAPPGLRARQRIDPVDFAKEPDYLAEGEQRADRQHAEDQPVETRVGAESERDLLIENENDKSDQREERRHAHQKNTRGREQADIRICRHGTPNHALKIMRMLVSHRPKIAGQCGDR